MTEWVLVAVLWGGGKMAEQEIENAVFTSPSACARVAEKLLLDIPQPAAGYVAFYKCRPRG